jgi:UDP-glucose 4-epimerase
MRHFDPDGWSLSRSSPELSDKFDRSSVAIVGGSGFVGSSLATHLSNHFSVTIVDKVPPKGHATFKICDVRDAGSLSSTLQGFDLVVNTAIVQIPAINENRRLGYEVNVLGTQNICDAVERIGSIKGLIHASSWHVFGERNIRGLLDEKFGYCPDKVEDRAKLYALCKISQETIVRITSAMSSKSYGIIRLGTILGDGMPPGTAANIFIDNALKGVPMTPFRHTLHRPMLYVDLGDVCRAFESLALQILGNDPMSREEPAIVNLVCPPPLTIIELARIVQKKVIRLTHGTKKPKVQIVDKGIRPIYTSRDKRLFAVDISRARRLLGNGRLTTPSQSIEMMLSKRMQAMK